MQAGTKKTKRITENALPKYEAGVIEFFVEIDGTMKGSIQLVKDILSNDGFNRLSPFTSQVALNLDEVEKKKSKQSADKTVDMVVGCKNRCLLMVENKFRARRMENLPGNLNGKISYSRSLIQCHEDFKCCPYTVVLLQDDAHKNFEQKKNLLLRLMTYNIHIIPMEVESFYQRVFSE